MTNVSTITGVESLFDLDGEDFIRACYFAFLDREPDEDGLGHFSRSLERKHKIDVAAAILISDEARAKGLHRSPLAAEIVQQKLSRDARGSWLPGRKSAKSAQFLVDYMAPFAEPPSLPLSDPYIAVPEPANGEDVVEVAELLPAAIPAPVGTIAGHKVLSPAWLSRTVGPLPTEGKIGTIWLDMTTSFEWTGGVVGILRTELELACGLKSLYPNVRYCLQVGQGFAEIEQAQLQWLFDAPNVTDAYMNYFGRYKGQEPTDNRIHVDIPQTGDFYHPFHPGDLVLAVGWMDSKKEYYYARLKTDMPQVFLCYLIYDIIMVLQQTKHLYHYFGRDRFFKYIKWISHNCDFCLFGGETAKRDTSELQHHADWPQPPGRAVRFGTDIMKSVDDEAGKKLLENMGVKQPFIITVGSFEPRKNHETLYRAYLMALEMAPDDVPQLIFCGKPMWRVDDLVDTLDRDPRLKGKLLRITPTDDELAALYANCEYTVLPSLYEGWSLTLPESLGQGKFCICCDTPPLREIGGSLVDYVEDFDVRGWADAIVKYAKNPEAVRQRAASIEKTWPRTEWKDTSVMVFEALTELAATTRPGPPRREGYKPLGPDEKPTIWMDLTISYLYGKGEISGIIRAELALAHYLYQLSSGTRYFAYDNGYFFEIEKDRLAWLFNSTDITADYRNFESFWVHHEGLGNFYRDPFRMAGSPIHNHPGYLPKFSNNSIVFFAAIDSDQDGNQHRVKKALDLVDPDLGVMTAQLIYDYTPILFPQFHQKLTCIGFENFAEFISDDYDFIVYGGRTAQRDGELIQAERGWRIPPSSFIEFGSDLNMNKVPPADAPTELQRLASFGITGDFIMTVGTIEPRKNHDMLYKAYLHLLRKNPAPVQLVIVGREGWKSDDFLAIMKEDERVAGRIIILNPADEDLDMLYRHCRFTLLPSFYEGWSLTLPESLSYGKFCLVSDVDPLREIGHDLVEYIHPLDAKAWAERIDHYMRHSEELAAREARIRAEWRIRTWRECAEMLAGSLYDAHGEFCRRITQST